MKTTTLFLATFLLMLSVSTFAQLNPIENLTFQQGYQYGNSLCPSFNCYSLSWSEPAVSTDTLLGYIIYQDNIPYTFTSSTDASCSGIFPCSFNDFYAAVPFWISVKAVYNNDSLVSEATDSIYVAGIMIGVDELKRNEFAIVKNPVKIHESISLFIPYCESQKSVIHIISQNGQIVREYTIAHASNSIITLPNNHLSRGIYFVCLQIDKKEMTTKLIIE